MRRFEDSAALAGDGEALGRRLSEGSHLFFRGLLSPERVLEVRRAVVGALDGLGWIEPGTDPLDARPGPNATGEGSAPTPAFFQAYSAVQRLQTFHELAHEPALVGVVEQLLGEPVLVHPRKIFRVAPADDPAYVTPPHQDYRLIQGTVDTLTVWIPLGDCPEQVGGLRILAGSHRRGLEQVHFTPATGGATVDVPGDASEWTSIDFEIGDVLLFHSLTIHAAKPNHSDVLRLSADFRYQALSQPVVAASLYPHYYGMIPGYDELTQGWSSTASVDVPAGLRLAEMGDPFDPTLPMPPSRLLGVG